MIADNIKNAPIYFPIHPGISTVFEYLQSNDIDTLEDGRYEIDEDDVFFIKTAYKAKDFNPTGWEAHQKYIDIQFVAEGEEYIFYNEYSKMREEGDFDTNQDYQCLSGEGVGLQLVPGSFIILFPQDAHQPGIMSSKTETEIKKIVFKVKV